MSEEPRVPTEPAAGKKRLWRRKRNKRRWTAVAVVALVLRMLGVFVAIDAVMTTRTAQGAIGWSVALVALPSVALPAYLVFGRNKFEGYVESHRERRTEIDQLIRETRQNREQVRVTPDEYRHRYEGVQSLTGLSLTHFNSVELLIDGEETFDRIIADIGEAQEYVLVQFYIVRDDGLGRRLHEAMIDRARAGVPVCFLYDEVGSAGLGDDYLNELEAAGVQVSSFKTTQGRGNRFQINFRNHRKIVVVDGRVGLVGGHNVGDEYLGLDPEFGFWRDTHMRVEGPSVMDLQAAFLADWYWATRRLPDLNWDFAPAVDGTDVWSVALPTGPADDFETAGLMFVDLIHRARERLWIATPYFVPDRAVVAALQLAGLRGVDVRILIPDKADSALVDLSAYTYAAEFEGSGVDFFRYQKGFLHQKVMLVDDDLSLVGTANLDNRSFRLNFEISQIVVDRVFASEMETMLLDDMAESRVFEPGELAEKSYWFRLKARVARLLAPLQ